MTPVYAEFMPLGSADLIEGLRWLRSRRNTSGWSLASPFQYKVVREAIIFIDVVAELVVYTRAGELLEAVCPMIIA